jgi:hypothetical protein
VPLSPVSVKGTLREVDLVDVVEHDLGLEALGVLQEPLHQFGTLHAVHVGRASYRPRWSSSTGRPCAMPVISTGSRLARAA